MSQDETGVEVKGLRELIERKMSLHWDMDACRCWFCEAGTRLGCAPRGKYLAHVAPRGTYKGDPDCPSQYWQPAGAAKEG